MLDKTTSSVQVVGLWVYVFSIDGLICYSLVVSLLAIVDWALDSGLQFHLHSPSHSVGPIE